MLSINQRFSLHKQNINGNPGRSQRLTLQQRLFRISIEISNILTSHVRYLPQRLIDFRDNGPHSRPLERGSRFSNLYYRNQSNSLPHSDQHSWDYFPQPCWLQILEHGRPHFGNGAVADVVYRIVLDCPRFLNVFIWIEVYCVLCFDPTIRNHCGTSSIRQRIRRTDCI